MTSLTLLTRAVPLTRVAIDPRETASAARPATSVTPPTREARADESIAARLNAKVENGSLTGEQGESLKQLVDRSSDSSTNGLMRTASEQLDQFDRILTKLRANMGGGATYGRMAAAPSGVAVDRLA